MLRPATPLAVVLFAAFALQLIATLSAPIIQAVPLGDNAGTVFGVFGSCRDGTCTPISLGYDASPDNTAGDFNFQNPDSRRTLTYILILHPVAALFTLVSFGMAIAAHFHAPSHSSKFLLGLIIFMAPTFLISTVAFVMDLVLFLPNVAWGTYLMIVASVLILVCAVLSCVMRRTIMSRKETRKRIAENAEMSGENFYKRQQATEASSPPPLSQEPTAPTMGGASGADNLPGFAVYDAKSNISGDDDRTPLNSTARSGTGLSGGSVQPNSDDGTDRYGRGGSLGSRGRGRGGYGPPRDQYGNPMPPAPHMGRPSQESTRSGGSRGGYGPPPRGGPRGAPFRGRGGPPRGRGGPMRGGPIGGRGGPVGMAYGGPSPTPDYNGGPGYGRPYEPEYGAPGGNGAENGATAVAGAAGAAGAYGAATYGGRQPSPGPPSAPGYGRQQSPGPPSAPGYGRRPSPGPPSNPGMRGISPGSPTTPGGGYAQPYGAAYAQNNGGFARAESPPPLPGDIPPHLDTNPDPNTIGQAVEMDYMTGSPAISPRLPQQPFSDHDSDVQGMVGMQQGRTGTPLSPTSMYSTQRTESAGPTRLYRQNTPPLQAIHPSPPPGAVARNSPQIQQAPTHQPSVARVSGDNYYEDVDPRFDPSHGHPSVLTPGPQRQPNEYLNPYGPPRPGVQESDSFGSDNIPNRVPSDSSHFTSISERGVNPNWKPEEGQGNTGYAQGGVPNRGPPPGQQVQQQRDFVLASNPDFDLGGGRNRAGSRAAGGAVGAGGMPASGMI